VTFYHRHKNVNNDDLTKDTDEVKELTNETFEEEIKEGVTLVDFWAPWCGPCRMQMPHIKQIAKERKDVASICKINVDEHKKPAIKMKIKNIPNIIIFKNGVAKRQLIGSKPKHLILKALDDTLNLD
jgi:thioredoxin 1